MVCKLTTIKCTGLLADLGEGPRELGPSLILGEKIKSQKEEKLTGQGTKNRLSLPFAQGLDLPLRLINTQEDLTTFQSDTDKISEWCNTNKMTMQMTREESPLIGEYNMEGQPLESITVYKDLGLFTTCDLSRNQHVDKITKANRVLGLFKRTCRDLNDIDTMKTLYYYTHVRPLL